MLLIWLSEMLLNGMKQRLDGGDQRIERGRRRRDGGTKQGLSGGGRRSGMFVVAIGYSPVGRVVGETFEAFEAITFLEAAEPTL